MCHPGLICRRRSSHSVSPAATALAPATSSALTRSLGAGGLAAQAFRASKHARRATTAILLIALVLRIGAPSHPTRRANSQAKIILIQPRFQPHLVNLKAPDAERLNLRYVRDHVSVEDRLGIQ